MKNEQKIENVATQTTETAAHPSATPFFARAVELGAAKLRTHVKAGARKQEQSEK